MYLCGAFERIQKLSAVFLIAIFSLGTRLQNNQDVSGTVSAFASRYFNSAAPTKDMVGALRMSYVSDSSDYGGDDEYEDDSSSRDESISGPRYREFQDVPAVEAKPVPLSKNSGSRFLALYYDAEVDAIQTRTRWERHMLRCQLMQHHVLWARCANLYNETFNNQSMADIVWSYPLLSAQKMVVYGEAGEESNFGIGHAICIDSNTLSYAQEVLKQEPILQALTLGIEYPNCDIYDAPNPMTPRASPSIAADLSKVKLFRWRHIKDHSLRQDDGMLDMTPWLIVALDRPNQEELRAATNRSHIEYLIDSERIVMAGPLHSCTSLAAVGNVMIVNALSREQAIEFAENDPYALVGLYETIRVHEYNTVDISGKFVTTHIGDHDDVRKIMKKWKYPLDEEQTLWLNS